jgi:hypothetical protein
MDLQTAADHVGVRFSREVDNFVSTKAQLPSWGDEMDTDVAAFVEALELWVSGVVQFSRNSERYMSAVERATGVVTLRPPENGALTQMSEVPFSDPVFLFLDLPKAFL